jgi:hypothetical protein
MSIAIDRGMDRRDLRRRLMGAAALCDLGAVDRVI